MFQVGDEVFIRGTITRIDDDGTACTHSVAYSSGNESYHNPSDLIPAHRVTVAPARRAAEFPKDWGRDDVFFSDGEGEPWVLSRLVGYQPELEHPWFGAGGHKWKLAEVEE